MPFTSAETAAMRRALDLAATPGFALGGNPRVGCVLISPDGQVVAEGYHRGAGTPHAEADALNRAGTAARGTTAVVTLEPCNHTGRTGPCAHALVEAGVARVVHAQHDPNPLAAGGAETLRAAGIDVESGLLVEEARALTEYWTFAARHQRPFVTWKFATTLDGRSAAADGTSQWITSAPARLDTHRLRAQADTMLVGTATVLADDPSLTVRDAEGREQGVQPLRAVMGERDIPAGAAVLDDRAASVHLRTRDPHQALATLHAAGARHVFCEGGPTLAAAFARAGLVDRVVAYVAPVLLGSGRPAVADLGITTLADALRVLPEEFTVLGEGAEATIRLTGTFIPRGAPPGANPRPQPPVNPLHSKD